MGMGIGKKYLYLGGTYGTEEKAGGEKPHKQDSRHILDEAQGSTGRGGTRGGYVVLEAVEDVRAVPAARRRVVETRHDRQEVGGGPVARLEARRLVELLSRDAPIT